MKAYYARALLADTLTADEKERAVGLLRSKVYQRASEDGAFGKPIENITEEFVVSGSVGVTLTWTY